MTTPVPSTSDPWPAANAGLLTRGLSAAAGGLCVPNMEQDMSSATKQRGGGGDNVEPVEEKARLPSSDCSTPRYAYLGLLSCFLWQCTADVTGSKILTLNIFHFLRDFSKHASLTWKTPSLSSFRFNDWWIKPIPAFTGQGRTGEHTGRVTRRSRVPRFFGQSWSSSRIVIWGCCNMHDWTVSTTRALAVCQLCGQRLGVTRLLVTLVSEEKAVKKTKREEQTRWTIKAGLVAGKGHRWVKLWGSVTKHNTFILRVCMSILKVCHKLT